MTGDSKKTSSACANIAVQPQSSGVCMACIETSGLVEGGLTNVERIMTAVPSGEAVGLNMTNPAIVDNWMKSVDSIRCRCFMNEPDFWVPKQSLADS